MIAKIPWRFSDLPSEKNGLKVFSCFCGGGGSSMGYKLSGFDVIGGCEIDERMAELYQKNIKPRLFFRMPIQDFRKVEQLQSLSWDDRKELYNLDILDGSPPCSVFSMAGNREKDWGKERKFAEGQQMQRLDDLFFHFIALAKELRPKIVVAENVKGLLLGNARGYVKEIFEAFDDAGYEPQLFLLNSQSMGVPQARERVFFVARRKDLELPALKLSFTEEPIAVEDAVAGTSPEGAKSLGQKGISLWRRTAQGRALSTAHENGSWFNWQKLHPRRPSKTLVAAGSLVHWAEPRVVSPHEGVRIQSFPEDYDFGTLDPLYVLGMSVPPLMMNRLSTRLAEVLAKTTA